MASTCVVSGTLTKLDGTAIQNATVRAYVVTPFFASNEYIPGSVVSTTSDASGNWSLTLVRTAQLSTPRSVIVSIEYPDGSADNKRVEYAITVPDTATASFSNLVTIA